MSISLMPLICGIFGLFVGTLLGFILSIFAIQVGRLNKREEEIKYREDIERLSLAERMNNQDYAFSHQPESDSEAIGTKQKKEDSSYQFLKRNRKD